MKFEFQRWWKEHRAVAILFLVVVAVYGILAEQGALPMLSPDETAVFALANGLWREGRLAIEEGRANTFLWLHPRSFTTQDGWLLPVGFPLWPALLGVVSWIGSRGALLWAAVLISASACIPLMYIARRYWGWAEHWAVVWAGTVLLSPIAILYGARSGFTLMPQLALFVWGCWLLLRGPTTRWMSLVIGVVLSLAVGLRPTESVWMVPAMLFCWYQERVAWRQFRAWLIGGMSAGVFFVLGVHWWVYGAPWLIGYLLSPSGSVPQAAVEGISLPVPTWKRFFPYGLSFSQMRQNIVAMWEVGFWPWMLLWISITAAWIARHRGARSRSMNAFTLLLWTTVWLLFYYGQGRYADHIGGRSMHLGNSFLRYLAPAIFGWIGWTGWTLVEHLRVRSLRVLVLTIFCASMGAGIVWAYADAEDGLLRGRREREHYAVVRADMIERMDERAIWISDRSDKMLFPERMSVSPVPAKGEIRRLLEAGQGEVFLYARPPRQQERDAWSQAGLELIERAQYERENVYQIRLRPDFAEMGAYQAH